MNHTPLTVGVFVLILPPHDAVTADSAWLRFVHSTVEASVCAFRTGQVIASVAGRVVGVDQQPELVAQARTCPAAFDGSVLQEAENMASGSPKLSGNPVRGPLACGFRF